METEEEEAKDKRIAELEAELKKSRAAYKERGDKLTRVRKERDERQQKVEALETEAAKSKADVSKLKAQLKKQTAAAESDGRGETITLLVRAATQVCKGRDTPEWAKFSAYVEKRRPGTMEGLVGAPSAGAAAEQEPRPEVAASAPGSKADKAGKAAKPVTPPPRMPPKKADKPPQSKADKPPPSKADKPPSKPAGGAAAPSPSGKAMPDVDGPAAGPNLTEIPINAVVRCMIAGVEQEGEVSRKEFVRKENGKKVLMLRVRVNGAGAPPLVEAKHVIRVVAKDRNNLHPPPPPKAAAPAEKEDVDMVAPEELFGEEDAMQDMD